MQEGKDWETIPGEQAILLVAGHNYPHFREGKVKKRDEGTGELVRELCNRCGVWGIISTAVQLDPNWYHGSLFRQSVKLLVKKNNLKTVLDIHGRREDYPNLIEFFPNAIFTAKFEQLIGNEVIKEFTYNQQVTLAEDLEKSNVACVEVEIRKDGRTTGNENNMPVMEKLVKLINKIGEKG
jgi:hypothetical protein